MDSSRFLILGANGQLGKALQAQYPTARTASHQDIDVSDPSALTAYDWSNIDVILNAAAYTKVDAAETADGRREAWASNASGVGNLARIAADRNITLVHISSEYVFDGTQEAHTETEALTPLGVYGQTKAAGDIAVGVIPKHYIVRTTWVVGSGANFVRTMIGLANRDIAPTVVSDQLGRLTFTKTLVQAIDHLLTTEAAYGTYNVSNNGDTVSWADVTRTIFSEMGRTDLTVTDSTTQAYFASKPDVAPRPLHSGLDLTKVKATGFVPSDWRADLHDYIVAEQAAPKE